MPFVTGWMGENGFAAAPTAVYGVVLMMAGAAYLILEWTIVAAHRGETVLARAVGRDRKAMLSIVLYAVAIPSAFFSRWAAGGIYALVAAMWLVPDARIEGR